jgi:hypothetical protein
LTDLGATLARHVLMLTGRAVPSAVIYVDPDCLVASAVLDGIRFQLRRGEVVLVRSCVHCGVRQLDSPAIRSRLDLGHALAVWEPRCAQCPPEDPPEW